MRFKLSILVVLALLVSPTRATVFFSTNNYVVAENQTVEEEQWIVAGSANTRGVFKDDLFIASETGLVLNGTYKGNVWGAAGTEVAVAGECQRNVRLMGQNIHIVGTIDGNLMAAAGTLVIETNAIISGSVRLIGTSIVQEGTIRGDATITSARVLTLDGTIEGDAHVIAPEIVLSDQARIKGNLVYVADSEIIPADDVVEGKLKRFLPQPTMTPARLASHLLWFVAAVLVGIPFIAIFPMTTAMASLLARKTPLLCLLVGFFASAALPVFGLVFIYSSRHIPLIGIPLGTLILAAWGALVYVSRIVVGLMVGTWILKTSDTSIGRVLLAMAWGLAIIYLITAIPSTIGRTVQMIVVWMGMGALLLALRQKRRLIIQVPEELKHLKELKNEQPKPTEKLQ